MSVLLIKHIYDILRADNTVAAIAGSSIYPVAAIQGVASFPFVRVYCEITGADYNKEGHIEDHCMVEVNCVSDDIDEAITLQQAVRDALEGVSGTFDTFIADPLEVSHADCIFNAEMPAFDAQIQFTTNTQKVG